MLAGDPAGAAKAAAAAAAAGAPPPAAVAAKATAVALLAAADAGAAAAAAAEGGTPLPPGVRGSGATLTFEAVEAALKLPAGGAERALVAAAGAASGPGGSSGLDVRIDGAARTAHVGRRSPGAPSDRAGWAALAASLGAWRDAAASVRDALKSK